ncbi:hypothetical protein BCR35DRAFT_325553 [Leucosporidium creatinivorum]|uniref:F-box domain-containing protein n=1 Tax=Leucosporidium creatinivorum TaxID=106004 RepID=A0A1Y2F0F8_9BASI|nr:hypothetical protein BCR35DRAFT_325553 [Leucosporidium creatinivorum]
MTTSVAARLKGAILTLWTQLDVEKGCLPPKSCRWLLEELKELQELRLPAGYASSSRSLAEAIDILQATLSSTADPLPLADAAALSSLLTSAVTVLASPLPPSTTYDPSRPTLPSEIISLILHRLAAAERTSEVAACCLASRSFLPLAREALYHTLYLAIEDQKQDDEGEPLDLSNSAKRGSNLAINYGRLASSLPRHPHLGSLVRRMEVSCGNNNFSMDHVHTLDIFRVLLDACRPHHVKLGGAASSEASHFARVLWQSRQRFRSLHPGAFGEDEDELGSIDAALWRLLQEQDTLEDLSLAFDESMEAEVFTRCPFTLKQLHLVCYEPDFPTAPLLHSLLHYSAATLTRLSFPLDLAAKAYTAPKLSHFSHLQELSLWLRCPTPSNGSMESLDRTRCHALFADLPPSVQSMTVAGPRVHSRLPLVVPLDRLPSTLEFLDTGTISFSPSTLLALVRSPSIRIRRLRYFDGGRASGDSCDAEWNDDAIVELEASPAPKAFTRTSSYLYHHLVPLLAREDEVSDKLGDMEMNEWSGESLLQTEDASWDEVKVVLERLFPNGVEPSLVQLGGPFGAALLHRVFFELENSAYGKIPGGRQHIPWIEQITEAIRKDLCMFSRRWSSVAQILLFQHVELDLNYGKPDIWIKAIEARQNRGAPTSAILSLALTNKTISWKLPEKSKVPKATLRDVLKKASTLCSLSLTSLTVEQDDLAMASLRGLLLLLSSG